MLHTARQTAKRLVPLYKSPIVHARRSMRAFIYDDVPGDQRELHDSGVGIDESQLADLGVIYRKISVDAEGAWVKSIDAFAQERGYKNRDQITVTKAGLGDLYESKIKQFFDEHLHEDEEIRFILDGSGFFDVRGHHAPHNEKWIRIFLEKGDLVVLPAGIYHRFTVDTANYLTALRLFQDEPKWTPYSRKEGGTDDREARKNYLAELNAGSVAGSAPVRASA